MSEITSFISKYPETIQARAEKLHLNLLQQLPEIQLSIDEPGKIVGYGYGPGYKQTICTLIPSQKGLKLGFYKGAEIPDPSNLLEGTGKVHKYVDIKNDVIIGSGELTSLIAASLRAYQLRGG